jgi:hypothetical protein
MRAFFLPCELWEDYAWIAFGLRNARTPTMSNAFGAPKWPRRRQRDSTMMPRISLSAMPNPHTYASITGACGDLIGQFMADARRHTGIEAQYRRERAYGVYMGWRALVAETADPKIISKTNAVWKRCLPVRRRESPRPEGPPRRLPQPTRP